ncbi:MAG: cupin domain-containing protein [Burkholderiales bacterium]|nr:cupin domain-containing protein [Burkholderiales bacterium]
MATPILNLADIALEPRPPEYRPTGAAAERFDARLARLTPRLGLTQLGCSLVAVPPRMRAFPFHSHRRDDELFIVLEGEGQLRLGEAVHPVRAGDVIGCPAGGPETAHQLVNTGTRELRYLAISSQAPVEVCHYPDSGKLGVFAELPTGAFRYLARENEPVDYWDGE